MKTAYANTKYGIDITDVGGLNIMFNRFNQVKNTYLCNNCVVVTVRVVRLLIGHVKKSKTVRERVNFFFSLADWSIYALVKGNLNLVILIT